MKSSKSSSKPKAKPKYNANSVARSAWRRAFSRSPVVKQVLDAGRRTVPRYKKDGSRHKVDCVEHSCECCLGWFKKKEIQVDHIDPVVDPQHGFQGWDIFFERLWCDSGNLQRLCISCHENKTAADKIIRNNFKKSAKADQV